MRIEKITFNNSEAIMTAYLLDHSAEFNNIASRPAVLIFPGGGYYVTSDREAEPIAMAYLAEGYNAFLLRYSVGKESSFKAALSDAEVAITLVRENADEWNIDQNKIAVIGFSAGGHLAASLGTMGKNRPNALILGYPCILSDLDLAFPIPSLVNEVDEITPPTFIFSTFEDEIVPIEHTISFLQALNEKNISFESHIFQKGRHGLSLAKPLSSSGLKYFVEEDFAQWFDLSISWLHKVLGNFSADKESMIPEAEDMKQYSIEVRVGSLIENADCKKVLIEYIPGFVEEAMVEGARYYSLMMINKYLPQPLSEDKMREMDERLKNIPFTN